MCVLYRWVVQKGWSRAERTIRRPVHNPGKKWQSKLTQCLWLKEKGQLENIGNIALQALHVRCDGKGKIYIKSLVSGWYNWVDDGDVYWDGGTGEGMVVWRREFVVRCLWDNRCSPGDWVYSSGFRRKISAGDKDLRAKTLGSKTSMQNREKGGPRGALQFGINAKKRRVEKRTLSHQKSRRKPGEMLESGRSQTHQMSEGIMQHEEWNVPIGLGTWRARWQKGHSNLKSEDPHLHSHPTSP